MVEIKKGDILRAENVRSGTSAKGPYWLCRVKGEKGSDMITIWGNDDFSAAEGDSVRVDEILSARHAKRKYNEKWYEETSVTASLSLAGGAHPSAFAPMPDDDGELPF